MHPFISIVVPTKNGEETMEGCMKSLVNLDYPKDRYEIIVVDGRSTDKTPEIARKYGAWVLIDEGRGRAIALNVGIEKACGDYIAFTDADCSPEKSWLKNLLKYFTSEEVAGVGGPNIVPKETNPFIKAIEFVSFQSPYAKKFETEGEVEAIAGCNAIYRARILKNFIPLPKVGYFEDTLLNFRIRKAGYKLLSAPDAIVWHYRHYSSPKSFFKQMVLQGEGEVQGVRLEKGLCKILHKLEGFSLPIFLGLTIILHFVSKPALLAIFFLVAFVLFALSIKCLWETKSSATAVYVPLVALIEGVGYSVGYIKEKFFHREER